MKPADIESLEAARASSLYLLSLGAVAHAVIAWLGSGSALSLAGSSVVLAAAILAGEVLTPHLSWTGHDWRWRAHVVGRVAYAGLLVLVVAASLTAPDPRLVEREVSLFVALQALFLLLSGLGGGHRGALVNALVLVALAALKGGPLAATAVILYVALLVPFLVFDHFVRMLRSYPVRRSPSVWLVAREALPVAAASAAGLSLLFWLRPPQPHPSLAALELAAGTSLGPGAGDPLASYRLLALLGLVGTLGVGLAGRLLGLGRRKQARTREAPDPLLERDEVLSTPARPLAAAGPGSRGRIVRAYVSFLERARRVGVRRSADRTPSEFLGDVPQPREALQRLTELFMAARYGPDEPAADEVHAAESAAAAAWADLRRKLQRRRARR